MKTSLCLSTVQIDRPSTKRTSQCSLSYNYLFIPALREIDLVVCVFRLSNCSWNDFVASILQRVAANDQSAMDECLDRYGGLVWSLVRKRCGESDAEDVVQEVFLGIWKSADRYDPAIAEESTFIAMITRRRLVDRIRRKQRTPDLASLVESNEPAHESAPLAEINDSAAHVRKLMRDLADDERRVIELSIDHDLSQSQIAEYTRMPLGTVKSHARRGMMRLRSLLREKTVKGGAR